MRFFVLDPNLVGIHGHHALYGQVICAEAKRRGLQTQIIGNKQFKAPKLGGVEVHALLETTCYQSFSQDPLFAAYEDVELGNQAVFQELSQLPHDFFQPSDLVLLHTVNHTTLLGTVSWIASIPKQYRPKFCIFLMLPSGIALEEDGTMAIQEPASALGYRQAFNQARTAGLDITFFGSGIPHAKEFSVLAAQDIPSHALLTSFDMADDIPPPQPNQVLLFAGDAKIDKGLALLPDIVETLLPKHPDTQFVLHANAGPAWGEALKVIKTLRTLAPRFPNLDLRLTALDPADYVEIIATAQVILLPYDPITYARKSSGVAWEAIASESILVVPQGTWLQEQSQILGAAFNTFPTHTSADIAQALDGVLNSEMDYTPHAKAAARRFKASNGIKTLFDQIAEHWVHRIALGGQTHGGDIKIAARDFGDDGWHVTESLEKQEVRWSGETASTQIKPPFPGDWVITYHGLKVIKGEQISQAKLAVDNEPIRTQYTLDKNGAWSLTGFFSHQETSPADREIQIQLPWAHQHPQDPRALGILATHAVLRADLQPISDTGAIALKPTSNTAQSKSTTWTPEIQHASWSASIDPRKNYMLGLKVKADVSPQAVRAIRVFANGHPATVKISKETDWHLEISFQHAGFTGFDLDIDVVFPEPIAIQVGALVHVPSTPQNNFERSFKHITDTSSKPAPKVSPQDLDALPKTKPIAKPAPAAKPVFADVRVTQIERTKTAMFLHLELSGFGTGALPLNTFHIKLIKNNKQFGLQLRERRGAFQLIEKVAKSGIRTDQWGAFVTFFTDHNGVSTGPKVSTIGQNTEQLTALFASLPALVEKGFKTSKKSSKDLSEWLKVAQKLADMAQKDTGK